MDARRADCADLFNQYFLQVAALQMRPFYEWVPSKANIADLPSRESRSTANMIEFYKILPTARRPRVCAIPFCGEYISCPLVRG